MGFLHMAVDRPCNSIGFCRVYRERILLKFIAKQRNDCCGWKDDMPITDSMTAVSWCDGDLAQVAVIAEPETQKKYKTQRIIANKQSAQRSSTEQSADLAKVFKQQHAILLVSTAENIDESNHPMKRTITLGFQEMKEQGLRLDLVKRQSLIDFLWTITEALTRSGTRRNILHGFESNGLVGMESKFKLKFAFPDFDVMLPPLATVRREVPKTEYELCKNSFPKLLKIQMEQGMVPESEFDRLGFPVDKDPAGNEVSKDATISREQCHTDWIRSGKADHFFARHEHHLKGSKLLTSEDPKSPFYNACPSKLIDSGSRKGCMESVQMFVTIGFNKLTKGSI